MVGYATLFVRFCFEAGLGDRDTFFLLLLESEVVGPFGIFCFGAVSLIRLDGGKGWQMSER